MIARRYLALVPLMLPALACNRGAELKPAASAAQPAGMDEAATATEQGVEVTASTENWPGVADIREEVTPVFVAIDNESDESIQVRYDSLSLRAPGGTTYRAIPPQRVDGIVDVDVSPGFGYDRFHAAPYYGNYYAGVDPYDGPFGYDPNYYNTYYPYWDRNASLPTKEMLIRAMPEGVLSPGGRLDGWVYFEHVQQEEGASVVLHADFHNADTEEPHVSMELPFVVD